MARAGRKLRRTTMCATAGAGSCDGACWTGAATNDDVCDGGGCDGAQWPGTPPRVRRRGLRRRVGCDGACWAGAAKYNNVCDGGGCDGAQDGRGCHRAHDGGGYDGACEAGAAAMPQRSKRSSQSAKDLSRHIVADWNLGAADPTNPKWEDLLFALPVDCAVCHRYVSEERLNDW